MKQRFDPIRCGYLASASAAVNILFLKLGTHPVDPLDIEALAQLEASVVPTLVVSLVADLAFYLLLIPVALALGGRVVRWVGVFYALIGATGAALLFWQWPATLYAADADAFQRVTAWVYFGLWNGAGAVAASIWWGALAWRTGRTHRVFAVLTGLLATLSLVVFVLFRLGLKVVGGGILVVLLGLLLFWPLAAARGPLQQQDKETG